MLTARFVGCLLPLAVCFACGESSEDTGGTTSGGAGGMVSGGAGGTAGSAAASGTGGSATSDADSGTDAPSSGGSGGGTGAAGGVGAAGSGGASGSGGGSSCGIGCVELCEGGLCSCDCLCPTSCTDGEICVTHGAASITSTACEQNPCAPNALSCDCAVVMCETGQLCQINTPYDNTVSCWSRCAAPDTPIATPRGERRIADLRPGDFVFSYDHGELRAVPIRQTQRIPAPNHVVVRVTLRSGSELEISPGHPTTDGRHFGDLRPGDLLDSASVVSADRVPYRYEYTYDILPDSDSGTYVAGGVLIGSTMMPASVYVPR